MLLTTRSGCEIWVLNEIVCEIILQMIYRLRLLGDRSTTSPSCISVAGVNKSTSAGVPPDPSSGDRGMIDHIFEIYIGGHVLYPSKQAFLISRIFSGLGERNCEHSVHYIGASTLVIAFPYKFCIKK